MWNKSEVPQNEPVFFYISHRIQLTDLLRTRSSSHAAMAASSENIVGETTKGINQPGPPELPTPIDTHTARDRALSIPHILKGVICGLSPWEIQDAEQVSKRWRRTIQ